MTTKISPFIQEQFPTVYREDGEFFIEFAKAYYRWLEETGNPLYHSRRLPEYFDVDKTPDEFLIHFRDKYLPDFALLSETDKRTLVKHAVDIYRSKGSIRSLKLLFKLVYNDEIEVHWPGDDILRPSDSKYKIPRYLEVSAAELTASFKSKEIRGEVSGAKAIVESVSRRNVGGVTIDVIQITNVRGQFLYDEIVTRDGIIKGAPRVIGSLTGIHLQTGGRDFTNGQIVDVVSENVGFGGKAKIVTTVSQSGQVQYELTGVGSGYSNTAEALISEKVLEVSNIQKKFNYPVDSRDINFIELEEVEQPLVTIGMMGATGVFTPGSYVAGANNTHDIIALGAVATTTQNTSLYTDGTVVVSDRRMTTIQLGDLVSPDPFTLSYGIGASVYQRIYTSSEFNNNTAVGVVIGANSSTILIDTNYGDFAAGYVVYTAGRPTTANAVSVAVNTERFTNGTISRYNLISNNAIGGSVTVSSSISTSAVDRTATAQYIAGNTTHIGVINISPTASFIAANAAYVRSVTTNAVANVEWISTGNPGSFDITSVTDAETIYLNTDKVYELNTNNQFFHTLSINAASYGFDALPTANVNSYLLDALTYVRKDIGTVATIGNIDPGDHNTIAPFVLMREAATAAFERGDYKLQLGATNGRTFIVGEDAYTSWDKPITTVTFTDLSGAAEFNQSGIGESVYQIRSDGSYAYGLLLSQSISGPTKTLTLSDTYVLESANGFGIPGNFDTSNSIVGISSGCIASNIASVSNTNISYSVQGRIREVNPFEPSITISRIRFADQDQVKTVIGLSSLAEANVIAKYPASNTSIFGMSANVSTAAGTGSGVATEAVIIDSGFAYTPGEPLLLVAANNNYAAQGTANVLHYGIGQGYWDTSDSFISDEKKIQDSEYYQELSYEIRSSLSKVVYERKVNDIAHVSGTKMFGAVYMSGIANSIFSAGNTATTYDLSITNAAAFAVGDVVQDQVTGTRGTVVDVAQNDQATFNGYSNVINGAVGIFNSNTNVTKGYNSPFNAELSVNEGRSIHFNSNTDVIQSVNFTVNGTANVSNVVTTTFNSSSNVFPGIFINDFGSVSISAGNTLTFDANVAITSYDHTFNANSGVANSTTIAFNANTDINSGKLKFNANSSIAPAWTTSVSVNSSRTKTIYYEVLDHYNPVVIGSESYWEPSFGYNTVVTGTKQVAKSRPVTKSYQYISSYNKVLVSQTWGIVGTTSTYVSDGKGGGHYETSNVYGWIYQYRYDPVYSTAYYTEYETYYETINVTAQVQATRTRSVYRYDPVYRTESYQTPDTEVIDYFAIANANTYISVGDLVRYHVSPQFVNSASDALTGLVDGRLYAVESANTTAIRIRDHLLNGSANTLPITWKKIFSYSGVAHNFTLVSGKSISGANSFITLTNANSYFSVGDQVVYSSTDGYGTVLFDHTGTGITTLANNSTLYVQSANTTGFALSKTAGGTRMPLTRGSNELHTITSYQLLSGTITTATASQFSANDAVVYRVLPGNNSVSLLQHMQPYFIQFANATHIALSRTKGGQRLPLTKGLTESGHVLVSTKAGNGVINVASASTKYKVGDSVRYYVDTGNTVLSGLTNNQVYYIEMANATHVALSLTRGGSRIELTQGATEGGHHLVGTNELLVDNQFKTGDFVQYIVPSGETAVANLSSNVVYRVAYTDSHSLRLSDTNKISSITIVSGGTGYSNDDIVTITDKTPSVPASIQLQTNSTGGITGYTFIDKGLGYTATPAISLLRVVSGGTGANLTATLSGNTLISFALQGNSAGHKLRLVNPDTNVVGVNGTGLQSNAIVLYYTNTGITPIAGLTNNSLYYVDSAGTRGIGLKTDPTSARMSLTPGSDNRGHSFVLAGANNTIKTDFASNLQAGDLVQYSVDAGNTPVVPLLNRNVYYVYMANNTHLALSATDGGPRLTLVRGKFEQGHRLYKVSGNSAVIATSYAANLVSGDVVRYVVNSTSTPIYPLTANGEYYVQFANTTHIALAASEHAPRLWMTTGSADTGHRFIGQLQKSTIVTSTAKTFTTGEAVKYVTASGNTPLTGFTNGQTYFVQFANDTHIAFSSSREGDRIDLFKGASEGGHWFSPTSTQKASIRALNSFVVGDTVEYAFAASNTGLIGVANNTTYYIEHANSTHFTLSTFAGGPRVDLYKGVNEAGHSVYTNGIKGSINVGTSGQDFVAGDQVRYFQNTGTNLPGIINGGVYYIQYANATHIALSPTVGGYRIPVDKGLTQSGHKIVKTGPNSLIVTDFAGELSVGEPVLYTSNTPLSIRPSGSLVSNTIYYVEFANASHVALSEQIGGERITLVRQTDPGSVHTLTDAVINTISVSVVDHTVDAQFTPGNNVINLTSNTSHPIANVNVSL